MACAVVYLWTRRFWSKAIAVLAVLLFTLSPTVLGHAGLATTDMALTATLPTAFFALLLWAEEPTWMHSVLLGAMAALAALSKFTSLGYLPAAALLAFAMWYLRRRPSWSKLRRSRGCASRLSERRCLRAPFCCRRWASTGEMGLLAFLLGVMLPAMSSPVNIGVLHFLPVYVSLSIIAALGLAAVVRWANTTSWRGEH